MSERPASPAQRPPAGFDVERYRPLAADLALDEAETEALLAALFEIMKSFVDLGFDVRTVPKLFPEIFEHDAQAAQDVVDCKIANPQINQEDRP
ncbi:MAG: hypothetical protein AAGI34_07415 [Pseudomonadota bacterium]